MMCEFHDSNCNCFGDMWWTDKCTCFSSIDVDNSRRTLTIFTCTSMSDTSSSILSWPSLTVYQRSPDTGHHYYECCNNKYNRATYFVKL